MKAVRTVKCLGAISGTAMMLWSAVVGATAVPAIRVSTSAKIIPMGRTLAVTADVRQGGGAQTGIELWPYVDGKRWGCAGKTDAIGRASFLIPLPNAGTAKIQVAVPSGLKKATAFQTGQALPKGAVVSNTVTVQVTRRTFTAHRDPERLVGMRWEPWFTPLNKPWDSAEAVSPAGFYDISNPNVIRQHCLWLVEEGIDFLLIDWTSHLGNKKHWGERGAYVNDLIRGTFAMLDVYAKMKKEGIPVPQVCLILGLDSGPQSITAINEQMRFVYKSFVTKPRYAGLWLHHEGKPLITIFNCGGSGIKTSQEPVDQSQFTVRWVSSQIQESDLSNGGCYLWMDRADGSVVDGRAESLIVSSVFFGLGGWLTDSSTGKRSGVTLVESFRTALTIRPKFLIINQWNGFAGCYDVEFNNDTEPTSKAVESYRAKRCSGCGVLYHNLDRALIDLYHESPIESTVLAAHGVRKGASAGIGGMLEVDWVAAGKAPASYLLLLDGKVLVKGLTTTHFSIDCGRLQERDHILTIVADGTKALYRVLRDREEDPAKTPHPATAEIHFFTRTPC